MRRSLMATEDSSHGSQRRGSARAPDVRTSSQPVSRRRSILAAKPTPKATETQRSSIGGLTRAIGLFCLGTILWLSATLPVLQSRADSSKLARTINPDTPNLPGAVHLSNQISKLLGTDMVYKAVQDLMSRIESDSNLNRQRSMAAWSIIRTYAESGVNSDRFNPKLLAKHLSVIRQADEAQGLITDNTDVRIEALSKPRRFDSSPRIELSNVQQGPVSSFTIRVEQAGRTVNGLSEADFEFFSNDGKTFDHFIVAPVSTTSVKSSVALLVDVSQSMDNDRLPELKKGLKTFLESCHPETRVMLIAFDHEVEVVVPFTNDRRQLLNALNRLQPKGATDITGALTKAVSLVSKETGTKSILLCTDGMDKNLPGNIQRILTECGREKISICTLGLNDATLDRKSLEVLSSGSGGTSVVAESISTITDSLNAVIAYQNTARYQVSVLTKDLSERSLQFRLRGDPTATPQRLQDWTKSDTRVGFGNR